MTVTTMLNVIEEMAKTGERLPGVEE